jgi:hypothetical protein
MKKYLYCKKCKKYPNEITEIYVEPTIEFRKWNGKEYELKHTNLEDIEFEQLCSKCKTKLKEGI